MAESRVVKLDLSVLSGETTRSVEFATNSRPINDQEAKVLDVLGVHYWVEDSIPRVVNWDLNQMLRVIVYETETIGTAERPIVGFTHVISAGTQNAGATDFRPVAHAWHGHWSPPPKAIEPCAKRSIGARAELTEVQAPVGIVCHIYFRMITIDIQDFVQLRGITW